MAFTYDNLGLCRHWSESTPASILKWHNRAVMNENFTSEWQAREQAICLSNEIMSSSSTSPSWLCPSSSHAGDMPVFDHVQLPWPRKKVHLRVGFAEDLEMWLGTEDSLKMYKIIVPIEIGASGCTPWSTPLSHEAASSSQRTNVAATTDSSGTIRTFDMRSSPSWASAVFDLLNREGQVEEEEEGPVVFVTSYYISHAHHRFHDQPRVLRFDMEFLEWERDVRFIWEDLEDPSSPVDLIFIRPEPPHAAFRGTAATVIVHQHFDATRSACLISTVHIMDPDTRFRESAHSVELRLQPARVLQLAEVDQVCAQRQQEGAGPCTIHIGHHIQDPQQDIATFHGLGIQIRVPSRLTPQEAEQNLVTRLQRQRRHRQAHVWDPHTSDPEPEGDHPAANDQDETPEDATWFMARRPVAARNVPHPATSSSSTSSTGTSHSSFVSKDMRRVVIFTIDGRAQPVMLSWTDAREHHSTVATAFGIEPAAVARLHFVAHRPRDLVRVGLQCFLLQTTSQPRPSEFLRLVLIDMEIFETQSLQPFAFRRLAKWMPKTINRRSVFRLLELETQLQASEERCLLWHNHVTIENTQTVPLQLEDGDYIQIYIGDKPPSLSCGSEIDSDVTLNNDDSEQHHEQLQDSENFELFQTHLNTASKMWQLLAKDLQIEEHKTAPHHERPAPTRIAAQDDVHNAERPIRNLRIHPDDHRYFERLFNENSLIECEEEGPIAYLETWYIHHQTARSCLQSRAVRLRHDTTNWIEDIVEPWTEEIDQALDITIHVVRPQPPCTNMECVLAHLIVEQSSARDHTVGLLTIQEPQRHSIFLQHCAFSLPTLMSRDMVLRQAGRQEQCQQRLCSVSLRNIPFGLVDWDEIPRAACLFIEIPSSSATFFAPAHQDRFDAMELMQQSTTRWNRQNQHRDNPDQHGISMPSSGSRCEGFAFNPDAPIFDPSAPNIATAPENIQELHFHWMRSVSEWEGGTAHSALVLTWFVDQYRQGQHICLQPRPVRLHADFRQWTEQLRSAWPDRSLPGAPVMIHVVTPPPPHLQADIAAHVIIVQNPQDEVSTMLLTGYDSSITTLGPFMQMAITTQENLVLDPVLMLIGLGGRCLLPDAPMTCTAWYNRYPVYLGRPFPIRDGYGIVLQLSPRQTQQSTSSGTVLLQTNLQILRNPQIDDTTHTPCERQTADAVAHAQRPQVGSDAFSDIFPAIGQKRCQDWNDPRGRTLIQVVYAPTDPNDVPPPTLLEMNEIYSAHDVAEELRSWGFNYRVFLCGEHDVVFAHPLEGQTDERIYIYCNTNTDADEPVFTHHTRQILPEHQHMRFLYTKGFRKAVVMQQESWTPQLTCVHFSDVRPEQESNQRASRLRTPWPAAQPCGPVNACMIDIEHLEHHENLQCQLVFDVDELHEFLAADNSHILWKDYHQFELPSFIREALDQCRSVDRIDRYVIFTDGSSQTCHKHKPPLWIAENDISDSWAFAVFAEQYGTQPDEPSTLEFLGWSCQTVLYDMDAAHSIGTSRTGSDASETEALFWAGLWRLSRNDVVPTVFVSDSRLVGDQAAGRCGSTIKDMPYYNLRAVFQALHAGIPGQGLQVVHVRSHTGDPFNELVDWIAKREPHESQYLPRQAVNMRTFQSILRHLWIATAQTSDVPVLTKTGY